MKFIKKIFDSIRGLITSLILILVIVFMINNREIVSINFNPLPIPVIETRMFILMLMFYFLGLITAILIYSNTLIKSKFRGFKQQKQIEKLQKQIDVK